MVVFALVLACACGWSIGGASRYWRRRSALAIGWTNDIWSWEAFLTDRRHHYSKW